MPNTQWQDLTNLVLVAGHAVYTADNFDRPADDDSWHLQSFQKGEAPFYIEHIRKGVELADRDSNSLLVFSGGQTRYEAGPRSEAQSYWMLANHFRWWWRTNVSLRATTEEFARDSFENLVFGICRFFECVWRLDEQGRAMQKFPDTVTVVSWAFKERRFDLHRSAIRFPESPRFSFEGVNNPMDLAGAIKSEQDNALGPFGVDQYGTGAKEYEYTRPDGKRVVVNLGQKRQDRNPMNRKAPYLLTCPKVKGLLEHVGPDLYEGELPW